MSLPLHIFIADDKQELCESIEDNIRAISKKFNLLPADIVIHKAFTDHAYEHGCQAINNGLVPDVCIFDLIFNGYSGVDLYNYIVQTTKLKPSLCIYTGVEKTFEKRKEAELLSSESQGIVKIINKPHINQVIGWIETLFQKDYGLTMSFLDEDPFDLL